MQNSPLPHANIPVADSASNPAAEADSSNALHVDEQAPPDKQDTPDVVNGLVATNHQDNPADSELPSAASVNSARITTRQSVEKDASKSEGKLIGKLRDAKGPRKPIVRLRWARRVSQGLFLMLFVFLLVQTTYRGSFSANPADTVRLSWPVEAFFLFDPYVALITFFSTLTVYKWMFLSLVVVALTLVFGRVFCGWICPMGTLNQIVAYLWPSKYGKGARRIAANRYNQRRQRVKYYILYIALGMALAGSAFGAIFDPFGLLVRSLGLSVMPAAQYVTSRLQQLTAQTDVWVLVMFGDGVNFVMTRYIVPTTRFVYNASWLLGTLFLLVVALNRWIPRLWCRMLCPLGALLGILSRFSLFGMTKQHDKCTNCNLCLRHCQGADSPEGGAVWRQTECHMCLNCESVCPEGVISFVFLPSRKNTEIKPDTQRRTALAATAVGLSSIPLLRASVSGNIRGTDFNPKRIRPPGAIDEPGFLDRCIRCGECMKVCPNNVLHPALTEAGLEGIWTPIAIPRIGSCDQSCVLCGHVCPTGAIRKFTELDRKGSRNKPPIKMGTAFYDFGRCLPWAMQTPCIVCEEFCPTSPKAIWVESVEVTARVTKPENPGHAEFTTTKLQRPHVDPLLCIGCGACEKACPVVDKPAIAISSVGESRSKTNVILLSKGTT